MGLRYVTLRVDLVPPHAAMCVQPQPDVALVALDIGLNPADPANPIASLDLSRHTPTPPPDGTLCWICNGPCARTPVGDAPKALGLVNQQGVTLSGTPDMAYAYLETL